MRDPNDAKDPQAVLHAAYSAVAQGAFDQLAGLVTDDVELHISGFGPMNGIWRGRADVVAATRKNFALVTGQKPEIDRMISQGDHVVVMLRESGVLREDGQAYDLRGVQWFTFESGKLKRIDQILASAG